MKIFETEHEKKSFAITMVLFVFLFLLLLLKFSTNLPEDEIDAGGGEIAINFGNSNVGSSKNYQSKNPVTPISKSVPAKTISNVEKIVTQEITDAPIINQTKKTQKEKFQKTIEREVQKPSKSTTDALESLLNGSDQSGDGNDKNSGNKGNPNGDLNSKAYNGGSGSGIGNGKGYGVGSGGGNGNYQLGNRKALSKPEPKYLCNDEGIVVVQIAVDQTGKVLSVNPGIKGTTNTAKCLLDQAKLAALNTRWQPDNSAPSTQIGKIIYNFKLSQ